MTVSEADQDAIDRRSLHERIAADLRDEIMSGELGPGATLPSTAQLEEWFSASNTTVQKALQLLKDEGLAVGRAGAAVTVREHRQRTMRPAAYMAPTAPGEPYRWISEAATGHQARGSSRLLEVAEVRPPADVAEALRLPEVGMALLRAQMLSLDDEPVELVKLLPAGAGSRDGDDGAPPDQGRYSGVAGGAGVPPRLSVDKVSARLPTQEQYTVLGLPANLPVLRTLRVVYSDGERPIEATVMAKAGHLYELRYEFSPS
ncbi:GntR family transcriptional regulator [Streptomyces sparsogenes]|uniref:GntR family transcriptional regulator n=1 Tax=Streptomyces sparsogenes TaxID=67365 RepID=UPI0033DD989B